MCRITESSVACLVLPHLPTLSYTWQDFHWGGGGVEGKSFNMVCVHGFPLQFLAETFLILRRTERDMFKTYVSLHAKYPFLWSDFDET